MFCPRQRLMLRLSKKRVGEESFHEGDIVNADGEILGRHRGYPAFTIGQRKGLKYWWTERAALCDGELIQEKMRLQLGLKIVCIVVIFL